MFVSIALIVGLLAVRGAAVHSLFGHRVIIVAKRDVNTTMIISESHSSSTSVPPCTTTVTSFLGEHFSPEKGSCSHTLTITSTVQPTGFSLQPTTTRTKLSTILRATTSTMITSATRSMSSSSASGKDSIPLMTSESVTSKIQPEATTISITLPYISPILAIPAECIKTVTSILGQFLDFGKGPCGQTVTIISTIQQVLNPEKTRSRSTKLAPATATTATTTSFNNLSTSPSSSSTTFSTLSTYNVSTSTTPTTQAIPSPQACTETVTSILGKPIVAVFGLCSQIVTVVTSVMETSGPQITTTSKSQPPVPVNTVIGSPILILTPVVTSVTGTSALHTISLTKDQLPIPIKTGTGFTPNSATPRISIPGTTFRLSVSSEQPAQTITGTVTKKTPELPIPKPTTSSRTSFGAVPATQEPQPLPATSKEPVLPPCTRGCPGPRPTILTDSESTYSTCMPIKTLPDTTTKSSTSRDEHRPTSIQESITSNTEMTTTALATASLPVSTVTNTPNPVAVVIGSQTIIQDTASNFVIGSQTLAPGSIITYNGQRIYAASSGGALVLNPAPPKSTSTELNLVPSQAVVIVDGTSITGNAESGYVIGTQTLHVGSAITVSGQVITLPSPAATQAPAATITQIPETVPVILVGSSIFTQDTASAFIIGSQTLSPGSAITISGQVISLSLTGNAVIVNGATATRNPTTFSTEIQAPVISLVVAGQTLTAGGRVTVGGDVLSLVGGATTVIGTVTVAAEQAVPTAKPTGKKSPAGRFGPPSKIIMALQIPFVVGLGACGLI